MKFSTIIATVVLSAASGYAFTPANIGRAFSTSLNAGSIVYYSTATGNTETVAGYIKEAVGCSMEDIGDASADEITGYDSLIVGAPTWYV